MFDYERAVKADVHEWLETTIYDWSAYDTAERWVKEIIDFECSLLEDVCGSCDGTMIKYTGKHFTTEREIVPSLVEISRYVTEFFEPEDFAYALNEEGIVVFDYIARRHFLERYLGSEEFKAEIQKRMDNAQTTEIERKRKALVALADSGMITADEMLKQYEALLIEQGIIGL